ncbi:ABC transporter ATP-binding protein [Neisseria canis]|uniref:Iron-uptake permease ATP-binding protein n=1 Tax=Neisseria canis TaxID=493 RepID=A0A448D9X6_9NEIS|nr:ABC transporter ATP-binding protein [Neisseria canis]OSI13014.1 ABC transporter ATP-binding protein [Neisseria canis]VEF02516.1 iron-uptake permease ATP-binding protein [Neisseria canis]
MTALSVQNLSLGYQEQGRLKTILQDFSLTAGQGELVSLLGPSGVGKSSLLRILAGLNRPLKGEVSLLGETVEKPHPRVGFVFQTASLLPWLNVRDNVAFGLDFKKQPHIDKAELNNRVEAALAEVGLSHAADKFPSELSGGMAQRVALARALARKPQVLLLDEPFSALDEVIRAQMQDLLREIVQKHQTAAVMVTHDIDEAMLISDRIVLIGQMPGRIIGTWQPQQHFPRHDKLLEMNDLRVEILQSLHQAQQHTAQTKTVDFVI